MITQSQTTQNKCENIYDKSLTYKYRSLYSSAGAFKKTGFSIKQIIKLDIEHYKRDQILDETNKTYEGLKKDPIAYKEELKERALWDTTLHDNSNQDT